MEKMRMKKEHIKRKHIVLKNKYRFIIMAAICTVAITVTGVTVALLNSRTEAADNEFKGAMVNIGILEKNSEASAYNEITEDLSDVGASQNEYKKIEENNRSQVKYVAVKNIDREDYPSTEAYVRVRLVPLWVYDSGDLKGQTVAIDLKDKVSYTYGDTVNWKYSDTSGERYYYYTKVLEPGDANDFSKGITTDLITSVSYTGEIPENAHFELCVAAEGIAAKQEDSLSKWGLNKSDMTDTESDLYSSGELSDSKYFTALNTLSH